MWRAGGLRGNEPGERRRDRAPGGRVRLYPERAVGIRERRRDHASGGVADGNLRARDGLTALVDHAAGDDGLACLRGHGEAEDQRESERGETHGTPFRRVLAPMEKDGPAPGILARGSTLRSLPSHAARVADRAQWLPAWPARGTELPAYSGGTAWASHPLRMVAGQGRRECAAPASVVPRV